MTNNVWLERTNNSTICARKVFAQFGFSLTFVSFEIGSRVRPATFGTIHDGLKVLKRTVDLFIRMLTNEGVLWRWRKALREGVKAGCQSLVNWQIWISSKPFYRWGMRALSHLRNFLEFPRLEWDLLDNGARLIIIPFSYEFLKRPRLNVSWPVRRARPTCSTRVLDTRARHAIMKAISRMYLNIWTYDEVYDVFKMR